jgi:signal transduction histidine kinase/PAS domain-containing protein
VPPTNAMRDPDTRPAEPEDDAIRVVADALANAEDPASLFQRIAETSQLIVSAAAAYVEQVSPEDQTVRIVAAAGKGGPAVGANVPYPGSLTEELIARHGAREPELIEDLTEQDRPIGKILRETCGACAAMIIPLRSRTDLYGVLVLLRPRTDAQFTPQEGSKLRLIADMASIAFKRADMIEKLRAEHDRLRRSEERARLVGEIGRVLGASLDFEETLKAAAQLLVPTFADWCTIDLLEPRGTGIRRIALTHGDSAKIAYAEELQRRYAPSTRHETNARQVIETGEPRLWKEISSEDIRRSAHDARHAELLKALGLESAIVVPIIVHQKTLGAISLMSANPDRRYDEADLHFAVGFGERAGGAIENARLHTAALDSTNRLQETLDRIVDAFFAFDRDWRLAYANPEAGRLLEQLFKPETRSLVGKSLWTAVPEIIGTPFERVLREAMEEQRATHTEDFFAPGAAWVEVFVYPSSSGVSVFARDVTERRRTQSAVAILAEVGSRVAAATNYTTTVEEIVRAVVPSFADYAIIELATDGFEPAAFEHRDATGRAILARALASPVPLRSPFTEPQRTGKPLLIEVAQAGDDSSRSESDGSPFKELGARSIIVAPLIARASVVGVMILARTSASKQVYSPADLDLAAELGRRAGSAVEKARLQRDLERAVRGRDEVLAVVAHDLRDPISTIAMSASLMDESYLTEADREKQTAIIRRGTERANRLIADLLDFAQIDAGTLTLQPAPLDIGALLREICELFERMAKERNLALDCGTTDDLPTIVADHDRVIQIFSNLLGNAIKFSGDAGRISVRAETRPNDVRFAVSDTGRGIPREELPHVFDRFWHSNQSGGAGLGLAIVKGIVEAHGGRISVDSTPGAGTTFVFTIPRSSVASAARSNG